MNRLLARIVFLAIPAFLVWVSLPSCEMYRPAEVVPSYIQIDTFQFVDTVAGRTGFPTQRISEVWVYAKNNLVGVFSLPTKKIPILFDGPTDLQIQAGIFTDGIRKSRVSYRFYEQFVTRPNLKKGETTQIKPNFRYPDRLRVPFAWYQDFETSDSGYFAGEKGNVPIIRARHPNSVPARLYGEHFALLRTQTDADIIEFRTKPFLVLPTQEEVFLEVDYKSSCPFQIGVTGKIGNTVIGTVADLQLVPRDTWTKVYISLGEETEYFHSEAFIRRQTASFQVFFRTDPQPGANQEISLDNLKLIR